MAEGLAGDVDGEGNLFSDGFGSGIASLLDLRTSCVVLSIPDKPRLYLHFPTLNKNDLILPKRGSLILVKIGQFIGDIINPESSAGVDSVAVAIDFGSTKSLVVREGPGNESVIGEHVQTHIVVVGYVAGLLWQGG